MKPGLTIALAMLCACTALSCRKSAPEKVLAGPPQLGALYSLFDGEGGYRLGKVLTVEDDVVFVKLFETRWITRPSLEEIRKAVKPAPVAYKPQSFTDMRPVHLENGTVSAEETDDYETWKKGAQEIY